MNDAITIKNISFSYSGEDGEKKEPVFRQLSLTIEEGSFVAVLGRNGCGKSTLAKEMNAILLPEGGSVYVYGMDTADEQLLFEIRKACGMVFQNPDNQIVANVVEEDVAFAPENLGMDPEEIRRRVDTALEKVGMKDYAMHAPHLLSGGQKQRIAIAGVLAMHPKCIVLDEPTAMLDPGGCRDIMKILHALHREGLTIVLITHHMNEAAQADRVVVMENGSVIADGLPKDVFSRVELLENAGLTVPDTVKLLSELNRKGYSFPLDIIDIDECAELLYQALLSEKHEGLGGFLD